MFPGGITKGSRESWIPKTLGRRGSWGGRNPYFRGRIAHRPCQAVILLRSAVEMEKATLERVEEVAELLRRLQIDPALRFEGRAWEE